MATEQWREGEGDLRPDCRVCVFSRRQSGPVPAFLSSRVPERAPGDWGWPELAGWIKAKIWEKTRNRGRDWAEYHHPDVKNGCQRPSRENSWRCSKSSRHLSRWSNWIRYDRSGRREAILSASRTRPPSGCRYVDVASRVDDHGNVHALHGSKLLRHAGCYTLWMDNLVELGVIGRWVSWEKCRAGRGESSATVGLASFRCLILKKKQHFAGNLTTTDEGWGAGQHHTNYRNRVPTASLATCRRAM
jgi:hypothetical protein